MKYSKLRLKKHMKDGMDVTIDASPFVQVMVGVSIVLFALGLFALAVTPLVNAIRWW